MKGRSSRLNIVLGLMAFVMMLGAGCSEKIVGNRAAPSGSIRIVPEMAPSVRPAIGVTSYLLTVTGSDMDTIVVLLAVDDVSGALVGDSAAVPYGLDRKFALRAVNITPIYVNDSLRFDTTVVLRGETVSDVVPGAPLVLSIRLVPVAPIFYFSPRYITVDWGAPFELDLRMFNIDSVAEIEGQLTAYDQNGREVLLVDSLSGGKDVDANVPLEQQGGWFLFRQDTAVANRVLLFPGNSGGVFLRAFMTIRYDQLAAPVDTVQLQLYLYGITRVDRRALPRQPIYMDYAKIEVHRTAGSAMMRVLPATGRLEDR